MAQEKLVTGVVRLNYIVFNVNVSNQLISPIYKIVINCLNNGSPRLCAAQFAPDHTDYADSHGLNMPTHPSQFSDYAILHAA